MRHTLETAPRDGTVVILEDDASGTYEFARWSPETDEWAALNGEPVDITPTHWRPMSPDPSHENEEPTSASQAGPSPRRGRLALLVDVLAVAALIGLPVLVLRYAAQGDAAKPSQPVAAQAAHVPTRDSLAGLPAAPQNGTAPISEARRSRIEAQTEALAQELADARRTIERLNVQLRAGAAKSEKPPEQARQALDTEQELRAAMANEMLIAGLAIETQAVQSGKPGGGPGQPRSGAASTEQSVAQARQRADAAEQDAVAARRELTTSTAKHRQAIEDERARSTAVATQLAAAQRDIETLTAQWRKANDEAKQARSGAAGAEQSLAQVRQRADAVEQDAAAARRELTTGTAKHRQAIGAERARSAALAGQLTVAQRDIEALTGQLRKATEDTEQLRTYAASIEQSLELVRQNAVAVAQEAAALRREPATSAAQYRQAMDEERARYAALEIELVKAQRELEVQAVDLRKTRDEAGRLRADVETLEQARKETAAAAEDAAALRRKLTASAARHQQALDEEGARSAALARDLAKAQRDIEAQAAQLRQAGEQIELLKQAEAAADAHSAGQEAEHASAVALKAAAAPPEPAFLQALDDERARSATLESELATARRDLEVLAAQLRGASDDARRREQTDAAKSAQVLEQERQKAAASALEAVAARDALAESAARHRQALDEERARSAALADDLATVRRDVETLTVRLSKTADEAKQMKLAEAARSAQSIQQEQQKVTALGQEAAAARSALTESKAQHLQALDAERARRAVLQVKLAMARREIETLATSRPATARAATEPPEAPPQQRYAAAAAAPSLEAAVGTLGMRTTSELAGSNPGSKPTPPVGAIATEQAAHAEGSDNPEAKRLIARVSVLLAQGQIAAARIVLERAAETGSAQAIFMLAETYDPIILAAWGTYGTRGEVASARELYAKAHAAGIEEAKHRLDALRQ